MINRTTTQCRYVTDGAPVKVADVSSWSVSNFSDSVLDLEINGVVTPIPAADAVTGEPGQFNRDGDGTFAKIDCTMRFANPAKNGTAILYFNALKCQG